MDQEILQIKHEMVSLIFPYFENPDMLELQEILWRSYPKEWEVIVVDDCSTEYPADDVLSTDCRASIWSVLDDIPWNQHGARNLGARVATNQLLWLSDIDNCIDVENMQRLLSKAPTETEFHTVERMKTGRCADRRIYITPYRYHCNTFLMTKSLYWKVNGYDEDYCGTYGGDGPFKRSLEEVGMQCHRGDCSITYFTPSVVPLCNTRKWDRKGPLKEEYRRRMKDKNKKGTNHSTNPIRFNYVKVR